MKKEEIDLWPLQTDFDNNMREAFKRGVLSETARKHWEQKWIPVSERLPEIDETTIDTFGYYSVPVTCMCQGFISPVITKAIFYPDKSFAGWHGGYVVVKWVPVPTFND